MIRRALHVCLLGLAGVLMPAEASARCSLEVDFSSIEDGALRRVLRCLNTEVVRLRRRQAQLERRLEEFERLTAQLPADYVNADGEISEEAGRAIGRASFRLTARSTGSANALPVEQRVLEEVCGKSGGCAITITFRQFSLFADEPKDAILTGPCQFIYNRANGAWALGEGCRADGATSGVDGDQTAMSGDEAGTVIAQSGGACILSESELGRAADKHNLAQDHGRGLFLLSIPSRQPDGIRRFDCELVLD